MKFARQHALPFSTRPVLAPSRPTTPFTGRVAAASIRADLPVRERVVTGGRQTAPVARQATSKLRSNPRPAPSFAAKRIGHAVEMFGACMMLATFLVLTLFG